jgi:hypothetical protein
MAIGSGRFAGRVRRLREHTLADLGTLFAPWVRVGAGFGNPRRRRLFFPLTDVLALPLPGLLGRRLLPGRGSQVPRVAGRPHGRLGIAQHRGVLQGTGPPA